MVRISVIEEYALKNHIPIMQLDGIAFLKQYILEHSIYHILEIGTAIGYSAIQMALVRDDIYVTSIERDYERYQEAVSNVKEFGLEDRIKLIYADAFDFETSETYDLIFIDAAKSQYIRFFEKFQNCLNDNGVIISDNLDFHGLVHAKDEDLSKNLRSMMRKLRAYIEYLENNQEFETTFLAIGDGLAVSKKTTDV